MKIKAIRDTTVIDDKTDFSLVELSLYEGKKYPSCKIHGAMNKVAVFKNKGNSGIWRCLQYHCRAGCEQSEGRVLIILQWLQSLIKS